MDFVFMMQHSIIYKRCSRICWNKWDF